MIFMCTCVTGVTDELRYCVYMLMLKSDSSMKLTVIIMMLSVFLSMLTGEQIVLSCIHTDAEVQILNSM